MDNILITGATGFLGSQLTEILSGIDDYKIYRQVRSEEKRERDSDILVKNISGETDWCKSLDDIDIIIHLAAKVHDMSYKDDHSNNNEYFSVNYKGTVKLLNEAAKANVKKIIFISTIKVNGESNNTRSYTEKDKPSPQDSYSRSKYEAERYIAENSKKLGINYVIIRPALVYGMGVKGNLERLINFVNRGIPFIGFKDQNQRAMIGLNNLCNIIQSSISAPIYNNKTIIASEKDMYSTERIVSSIYKLLGRRSRIIILPSFIKRLLLKLPFFSNIVLRLYGNLLVSNEFLHNVIGWKQPYTFEEELKKMLSNIKR